MKRLLVIAALSAVGCGARYGAHTVGRGNAELRASLGGPVMSNVGAPLPAPLVRGGIDFGVHEKVDFEAGMHVTAAAFGVAAADLGARIQLLRSPDGSALALTTFVDLAAGTRDGGGVRAYPELGLHGELPLGPLWRIHAGALSLVQLAPPEGKPPVFIAPYAAIEYGRRKHNRYGLQLAWISPWQDSTSVVNYQPGSDGALLVRFGYRGGLLGGGQ